MPKYCRKNLHDKLRLHLKEALHDLARRWENRVEEGYLSARSYT
ncbi:hypothetical protein [Dyella sp.]